jgi:hypothetical protein
MGDGFDIQNAWNPSGNGAMSSQRATPTDLIWSAATEIASVTIGSRHFLGMVVYSGGIGIGPGGHGFAGHGIGTGGSAERGFAGHA